MPRALPEKWKVLLAGYHEAEGDLGPARRGAIRRTVTALSGGPAAESSELPDEWRAVLEKLATSSWKVLDEDIEALRVAGLSDGEVFDLVATAALAAGEMRLAHFYALLPDGD